MFSTLKSKFLFAHAFRVCPHVDTRGTRFTRWNDIWNCVDCDGGYYTTVVDRVEHSWKWHHFSYSHCILTTNCEFGTFGLCVSELEVAIRIIVFSCRRWHSQLGENGCWMSWNASELTKFSHFGIKFLHSPFLSYEWCTMRLSLDTFCERHNSLVWWRWSLKMCVASLNMNSMKIENVSDCVHYLYPRKSLPIVSPCK